ncbi:hypothetical protein [Yersinia aldovae]|uniref:hypothetical protein n=1 Tax=Yersinia aldovae TaxID=29483 RepID=UPI0011A9E394|nr:hypothetical protein [Yersinia aldovae]
MSNNHTFSKIKKIAKNIITPAAIMGFITLIVIWLYLNRLGRLDVFISSITLKDILIVIAVTFIISTIAFSILFFIPSLLLITIIKKENKQFHNYSKIKGNFIKIAFYISLFSVSVFYFSAYVADKYKNIEVYIIGFSALTVLSFSIIISYRFNNKLITDAVWHQEKITRVRKAFIFHFILPACIFIMTFFYSFPLSLVINKIPYQGEISDVVFIFSIIITSLVIIIFSLIPGIVFLRDEKSKSFLRKNNPIWLAMVFSFFSLSWIITPVPALIMNATMKISGISDYNEHFYLINEKDYPSEIFNDGKWDIKKIENKGFFLIKGVNMYALGDIKLICPSNVLDAYKDSVKFIISDRTYNEKINMILKEKTRACHPFIKSELKEFNITTID